MQSRLSLFTVYGVEIEYMIVDIDSLDVLPITDKVMYAVTGEFANEVERGEISWSNELALHVIELKTTEPKSSLQQLDRSFHENIQSLQQILRPFNATLMPTGMHPWMDPFKEIRLWPHEYNPIYETYDKIFDCRGHGWANLQCSHLNLPFANDEEFARLHAAIRVILPLLPAISASSPIRDGKITNTLDNRLDVYRFNSQLIPSITGKVIPETVYSESEYKTKILETMYRDIAPFDPEKILQHEWLNSRGAIARFDRSAIEIRTLDTQECPLADLSIIYAIVSVLKALVSEKWSPISSLQKIDTDLLHQLLLSSIQDGEQAKIMDRGYLNLFGFSEGPIEMKKLWDWLIEKTINFEFPGGKEIEGALHLIQTKGPLARRILAGCKGESSHDTFKKVYGQLRLCLAENKLYEP